MAAFAVETIVGAALFLAKVDPWTSVVIVAMAGIVAWLVTTWSWRRPGSRRR